MRPVYEMEPCTSHLTPPELNEYLRAQRIVRSEQRLTLFLLGYALHCLLSWDLLALLGALLVVGFSQFVRASRRSRLEQLSLLSLDRRRRQRAEQMEETKRRFSAACASLPLKPPPHAA